VGKHMKPTSEVDLFIDGPTIITMDRDYQVIQQGAIAVSGDRIARVLPSDAVPMNYTAKKVLRADGMVAIPGLINAHSHLAMTLFRGLAEDLPLDRWLNKVWEYELSILDERAVCAGFTLALAEMIRSGVTCAHDMYWNFNATMALAEEVGYRLISGPPMTDIGDIDPASLLAQARSTLEGMEDFEFVHPVIQAHSVYTTSPEMMREVMKLKHEFGIPFTTHASETQTEVQTAVEKFGRTPIELLRSYELLDEKSILAHCVHVRDDEIEILKQSKSHVVHCPESNLKLGSGIAPIAEMLAAGINVCVGTDGAASNNDLDMLGELRTAALLQKGARRDPESLTTLEVMKMATINAARAYGLDHSIGSLEPGKQADIVLLDFEKPHLTPVHDIYANLIYAANKADIETVVIGGKIHLENGELTMIDEEKVLEDARIVSAKFH
jgi:5-methylthioadenosine/S-adenosylhomocysteine deaminase